MFIKVGCCFLPSFQPLKLVATLLFFSWYFFSHLDLMQPNSTPYLFFFSVRSLFWLYVCKMKCNFLIHMIIYIAKLYGHFFFFVLGSSDFMVITWDVNFLIHIIMYRKPLLDYFFFLFRSLFWFYRCKVKCNFPDKYIYVLPNSTDRCRLISLSLSTPT